MKYAVTVLLAVAFVLFVPFDAANALQTKKDKAIRRCEINRNNCDARCSTLIDIDNAIRDCENRCKIRNANCLLRADQLGPTQSQPGDTNTDVPVLSTD